MEQKLLEGASRRDRMQKDNVRVLNLVKHMSENAARGVEGVLAWEKSEVAGKAGTWRAMARQLGLGDVSSKDDAVAALTALGDSSAEHFPPGVPTSKAHLDALAGARAKLDALKNNVMDSSGPAESGRAAVNDIVLVVGQTTSGKSTLVNAIVACDILGMSEASSTTKRIIAVGHGESDDEMGVYKCPIHELTSFAPSDYGSEMPDDRGLDAIRAKIAELNTEDGDFAIVVILPPPLVPWVDSPDTVSLLPPHTLLVDTPGLNADADDTGVTSKVLAAVAHATTAVFVVAPAGNTASAAVSMALGQVKVALERRGRVGPMVAVIRTKSDTATASGTDDDILDSAIDFGTVPTATVRINALALRRTRLLGLLTPLVAGFVSVFYTTLRAGVTSFLANADAPDIATAYKASVHAFKIAEQKITLAVLVAKMKDMERMKGVEKAVIESSISLTALSENDRDNFLRDARWRLERMTLTRLDFTTFNRKDAVELIVENVGTAARSALETVTRARANSCAVNLLLAVEKSLVAALYDGEDAAREELITRMVSFTISTSVALPAGVEWRKLVPQSDISEMLDDVSFPTSDLSHKWGSLVAPLTHALEKVCTGAWMKKQAEGSQRQVASAAWELARKAVAEKEAAIDLRQMPSDPDTFVADVISIVPHIGNSQLLLDLVPENGTTPAFLTGLVSSLTEKPDDFFPADRADLCAGVQIGGTVVYLRLNPVTGGHNPGGDESAPTEWLFSTTRPSITEPHIPILLARHAACASYDVIGRVVDKEVQLAIVPASTTVSLMVRRDTIPEEWDRTYYVVPGEPWFGFCDMTLAQEAKDAVFAVHENQTLYFGGASVIIDRFPTAPTAILPPSC